MEVRYTLSLNDYVNYLFDSAKKNRLVRRRFLFDWLGAVVVFAIIALVLVLIGEWYGYLSGAYVGVIGVIYTIRYPFKYRQRLEETLRATTLQSGTRGILGVNTLILSEESCLFITETVRSEVKWKELKEVTDVTDCTYITFHGLSIILPRLGFDSDEVYFAVRDFALRKSAEQTRQDAPTHT